MELTAANALDRTALLIRDDILGKRMSGEDIVAALLSEHVRITGSASSLATPSAQTATVALALQHVMSGIAVELDFPDVPLAAPQPPLSGTHLHTALSQHIATTWPWAAQHAKGQPIASFFIGDTPPRGSEDIVVTGSLTEMAVGASGAVSGVAWVGDDPIGATAAGIAGAVLSLRATFRRMSMLAGIELAHQTTATTITLDVRAAPGRLSAGLVPVVSAGAITHGALFVLLRTNGLDATFRVFDRDILDVPNLNRYSLATAAYLNEPKVDGLALMATTDIEIVGEHRHYRAGDGRGADRILVGADDIPIRWTAQDDVGGWLGVGATSHLFAQVSTHTPGAACAGCVHPSDDDVPETIPTISVVSGWAGLLLAEEFLHSAPETDNKLISAYPLGLGGRHALSSTPTRANDRCPRQCRSGAAA